MKDYNKFLGIDIIRVVSMFCVIFLHCASNRLRVDMGSMGWSVINILTAFATCGVPMFFMISGALILNSKKTLSVKYTLKDRVLKLFIPMIVWSVIAVIVRLYTSTDLALTTGNFYNEIIHFFNKPVAVHLWFMYYLIPMYLISPALKIFVDNAEEKVILYIVLLWLIEILSFTLSGILSGDNQKAIISISLINNIGFISGYLGYFIVGWYLFNKKINISNVLLIAIVIGTVLFISAGTRMITDFNGFYTETFKSYRSIFVVILSCAMFLILYKIESMPKFIVKFVAEISILSYGVYLSHNVIIDLLNRWGIKNHRITDVILSFAIASIVSVLITGICRRIKYISYLFAGIKKS